MEAKMEGISQEHREAYEEFLSGLDTGALTGPVDVAQFRVTNADGEKPQGLARTKKTEAEDRKAPQAHGGRCCYVKFLSPFL